MKKLMIAAALALGFASMSQAAVYYWGAEAAKDLATYNGQTIYVLASTFDWTDATTAEDVMGAAVSQGSVVSGGRGAYLISQQSFTDTAEVPSTYNALFVLIDGDGKYAKWNETLTGNTTQETNPVVTDQTAAGIAGHIAAQGGMKSFGGDVPEPTSAMLLLLGVAGLALRRRA